MNNNTWQVFHFGLLVTGRTEEKHLPKLFNALQSQGGVQGSCHFEVIRFINQLRPKKKKTKINIVGKNKEIPDKTTHIGFAARKYINKSEHHYVLLIDELKSIVRRYIFLFICLKPITLLMPMQSIRYFRQI